MPDAKRVLFIGLDPKVVDYARWPGLDAGKVEAGLRAEQAKLKTLGYDTDICFVDRGDTAERVIRERLAATACDCVLIGAGIRADADLFLLFERVVNVVHASAPRARICFNTNPADSADAVRRWV